MASYQKVTSVDLLIRWLSYTWNTTSRRTFCATDFIWCSCTFRKTIAAHVYFQYLTRMGHTHFSIVRPQNKAHYWGKFTYSFCYMYQFAHASLRLPTLTVWQLRRYLRSTVLSRWRKRRPVSDQFSTIVAASRGIRLVCTGLRKVRRNVSEYW